MERASGVLCHISSLPGAYGIGNFGKAAYDFVDFLAATGQSYWQVLPLTMTSFGDSPYQSFSAFAGNPYFIDLETLMEQGLLTLEELDSQEYGSDQGRVDYEKVYFSRQSLLKKAVERFEPTTAFEDFCIEESDWLDDFAEFMAIKEAHQGQAWYQWEDDLRNRHLDAMSQARLALKETIYYYKVCQYLFETQWRALKDYAHQKGIQFIGDLPIYVAQDSVEMWAQSEYFQVDEQKEPTALAGTPPDAFSDEGQFWGNPLYDWDYMKERHYDWWVRRVRKSLTKFDLIRLDHFRGFEAYWKVPAQAESAKEGAWEKGPGQTLFETLKEELGDLSLIAEDLGVITPEVESLKEWTDFPGMKVCLFGFQDLGDSDHLPHHYEKNSLAYVGTHDNETARGWYQDHASEDLKQKAKDYLSFTEDKDFADAMNRAVAMSSSSLAIYNMQDLLNLGNEARMNQPSVLGGNWSWRMHSEALDTNLQTKLLKLTQISYRMNSRFALKDSEDVLGVNM